MESLRLVGATTGSAPTRMSVSVGGKVIGNGVPVVIAGPCAVESEHQLMSAARAVVEAGGHIFRAGAYKPRSSPYSFQGLGEAGLKLLRAVRQEFGLPIVTEVMSASDLEAISESVDMLQIGARNMQNFDLLKAVGRFKKPVLLKRGTSATIEEWLLAAEYIALEGNSDIVLCERGIRTYEPYTRNTLDLSAVPAARSLSRLPVVVDPSHGTGRSELVLPMTRAALAAGADGVMIEVHPSPDAALSDGRQSLDLRQFGDLMSQIFPKSRVKLSTYPALEEFVRHAADYSIIPLCADIMADLETTVSTYLKLGCPAESFLLESVQGGDRLGRHSFIGMRPLAVISSVRDVTTIDDRAGIFGSIGKTQRSGNPVSILSEAFADTKVLCTPGLPKFFGGCVGYLGYDMARHIEHLPDSNSDDLGLPDMHLVVPGILLVFDHVTRKAKLVANVVASPETATQAYRTAVAALETIASTLASQLPPQPDTPYSESAVDGADDRTDEATYARKPGVRSTFTREEFMQTVGKAREYIAQGEVFQVVLSQRFSVPTEAHPFWLYRKLRSTNPSPYMFYYDSGSFRLVGSSPEILVRLEDGRTELRPIAGTARRGTTLSEDSELATALLSDEKERAEHVMLVDLGRNDLGRVCSYGTVRPHDLMTIERYSHVMHIVSGITGELRPGLNQFDLLRAVFPAGTLTGAPKVRAMEIIDELEPSRRGPYGGVVGYFGWNGNMDTCITIRTMVVKDGVAHVQAGAGIVADSSPSSEYDESVAKAMALMEILAESAGGSHAYLSEERSAAL